MQKNCGLLAAAARSNQNRVMSNIHNIALFSLSAFAFLMLSACEQAPAPAPALDLAAEEAKIREGEAQMNKDWAAKDTAKIAAHYAEDAIMMVPAGPPMKSKAAIEQGLKPFMGDPNLNLVATTQRVEVSKAGDLATSQGTYSMTMSDAKSKKPATEKGTYVTVYRKQADGSWKVIEDINTPDGSH